MVEDLEAVADTRHLAKAARTDLYRGDARDLSALNDLPLAEASVGLCMYSPPYLNCIDYTEVYKLELWLLRLVQTQEQFREVRLGTLRSHPSVKFPAARTLDGVSAEVAAFVEEAACFLEHELPRRETGTMVRNYFSDMYYVFREQAKVVEEGGHIACVVGNSTFSHREKNGERIGEAWTLPMLTDVVLARLAEAAGFAEAEIWHARDLRPRNIGGGSARESVVVARR
jgi:hypothetical protein